MDTPQPTPTAPEVFTADYLGTPGKRTFFIQVQDVHGTTSYLVEKAQVAALAERLREMLVLIDQEDTIRSAVPARDPGLALVEPVEPTWRIGTIGLAYEEGTDQVVIAVEEIAEEEAPEDPDRGSATFLLRRDQVRAFVLHSVAIVDEGREICQLCGLPMDPAGHQCPASNGHHVRA
ncbi:MAG: DUF3090 family protein [Actinomycetota bacterium]